MHAPFPYLGVLFGLSLLVSGAARSEDAGHVSASKPQTREALEGAADTEFRASAQALRERLERADAGDTVGVAVAEQALKAHRDRYLDLKRALARLSASAAAARNPFEPDFHVPREGIVKPVPPTRSARWDLYARTGTESGVAGAPIAETSPDSNLTQSWGMYASSSAQRVSPASASQPVEAPASPAVRPFLVYRAPKPEGLAQPSTDF